MILFVSGRCDIPAHFSEWLFHRFKAGFVDVRNPYNSHQISRIVLQDDIVDCVIFCTKNPIPLSKRLHEIPFPYLIHITLTAYHKDIEPNLPNKKEILACIKTISKQIGKEKVIVRYDPILLNPRYTIAYHTQAFETLCRELEGYVDTIIISFVDHYQNTRKHHDSLQMHTITPNAMHEIGKRFGEIAKQHHIQVQTCAEAIDLSMYGIQARNCFEEDDLNERLHTNITFDKGNSVRHNCSCLPTVDIGDYNTCPHLCQYCYANYDETQIKKQLSLHDPNSSVLIGHITSEDHITIRE